MDTFSIVLSGFANERERQFAPSKPTIHARGVVPRPIFERNRTVLRSHLHINFRASGRLITHINEQHITHVSLTRNNVAPLPTFGVPEMPYRHPSDAAAAIRPNEARHGPQAKHHSTGLTACGQGTSRGLLHPRKAPRDSCTTHPVKAKA